MLATEPARAVFAEGIGIGRHVARTSADACLDDRFQKRRSRPLIRMFPGFLAGILFPMFALALNANAVQLINDGGFESGLTGWTTTTSAGSGGNWFADTTTSTPLTGAPTVGPHSGTGYAVTDQVGPGVNAMSQDYTVGTTTLTLTFDMFVNDWNSSTGTANVQVLILAAGGNPVTGVGTVLTMQDILVTGGVPNPYAAFNLAIPVSFREIHTHSLSERPILWLT